MPINFKRVLNFAFTDFYRHRGLSVAAIFVLTIAILICTSLFLARGASNFLIETVKNKIDITAYFKDETNEQDILAVRDEILRDVPEIKSVEYVSKEDALAAFNEKHGQDPTISQALEEVGGNPFLPSLNIITSGNPIEYENIANILEGDKFSGMVQKVDFSQKRDTIEKVYSITRLFSRLGIALAAVLFLVVILVVFNTIKLIIENSKEEINTMRLVGASSWFIRAPFIVQGALFGAIAFLVCFVLTLAFVYFFAPILLIILPGFNIFHYFISNLLIILTIQMLAGIGLGVVASFIVVRKYLAN